MLWPSRWSLSKGQPSVRGCDSRCKLAPRCSLTVAGLTWQLRQPHCLLTAACCCSLQAQSLLQELLGRDPDNGQALHLLATIAARQDDWEGARTLFGRALKVAGVGRASRRLVPGQAAACWHLGNEHEVHVHEVAACCVHSAA